MVNKITSAITPNETADKINEIIDDKQDVLVSGTNIKTINSESILGSGDITISGSSLPSQTGNAGKFLTTDGTDASWDYISQRNIGEIVTSSIPLTDAGLHPLDGALISGAGIYADFVTHIAGLVNDYPGLFCTEAQWQQTKADYFCCGQFVYDSVNNTVRLPKLGSGIRYIIHSGTNSNGWYIIYSDGWCEQGGEIYQNANADIVVNLPKPFADTNYVVHRTSGYGTAGYNATTYAIHDNNVWNLTTTSFTARTYNAEGLNRFRWSAQGYIDMFAYQYQYIVIATSTKTDIEVDIDEIATDLNGKADVDLNNASPSQTFKNNSIQWGMPDYSAYISIGAVTTYIAPSDGFISVMNGSNAGTRTLAINGLTCVATTGAYAGVMFPVNEGDVITASAALYGVAYFYPLKGV